MRSLLIKMKHLLPFAMTLGTMVLIGCSDSKYDFNEVDYTIGVGSDGLSIPGSSTAVIQLDDVLELNDEDCVKTLENGDYVFVQEGEKVKDVHPNIETVIVKPEKEKFSLDLAYDLKHLNSILEGSNARGLKEPSLSSIDIKQEGELVSFKFDGTAPSEVKGLIMTETNATFRLKVNFPSILPLLAEEITSISLKFPPFLTLGKIENKNGVATVEGSTIILNNVKTSKPIELDMNISELNFPYNDKDNKLSFENGEIHMEGSVYMSLTGSGRVDKSKILGELLKEQVFHTELEPKEIEIISAKGYFSPKIDLDNLGDVKITGIPDFLTDGSVTVDLYNPQIYLTIDNDMNAKGIIYDGKITSIKNGYDPKIVVLPELEILQNTRNEEKTTTKICICRKDENIREGYTPIVVSNLSDIIMRIPDEIKFSAKAKANEDYETYFKFGHEYTIKPSYEITAPIAFAENAKIVYTESFDGLCEDLKDITLENGTKVEITAKVESRLPIHLGVEVTPVDVNGNDISKEFKIAVDAKIAGTQDVNNPAVSDIKVIAEPNNDAALHKLDGFKFTISGTAKSTPEDSNPITGVTLNSKKHSLVAKDIIIKLTGKAIVDLN